MRSRGLKEKIKKNPKDREIAMKLKNKFLTTQTKKKKWSVEGSHQTHGNYVNKIWETDHIDDSPEKVSHQDKERKK